MALIGRVTIHRHTDMHRHASTKTPLQTDPPIPPHEPTHGPTLFRSCAATARPAEPPPTIRTLWCGVDAAGFFCSELGFGLGRIWGSQSTSDVTGVRQLLRGFWWAEMKNADAPGLPTPLRTNHPQAAPKAETAPTSSLHAATASPPPSSAVAAPVVCTRVHM